MRLPKFEKIIGIALLIIITGTIYSNCLAENTKNNFYGVADEGEGIYRLVRIEFINNFPKFIYCISDEAVMNMNMTINGNNADDIVRETFYDGTLSINEAKSIKSLFQHYQSTKFLISKNVFKKGTLLFETKKGTPKAVDAKDYFIKFNGKWLKDKITGEIIIYQSPRDNYPSRGLTELYLIK